MAALGVADVWNHEQDLLGALGRPGSNDPAVEHTAIEGYAPMVGGGWSAAGVAPLRVVAGDPHVLSGEGEPGATVTGPPYELARALAGRRTEAQLRAFTWDGDADPYIETLAGDGTDRAARLLSARPILRCGLDTGSYRTAASAALVEIVESGQVGLQEILDSFDALTPRQWFQLNTEFLLHALRSADVARARLHDTANISGPSWRRSSPHYSHTTVAGCAPGSRSATSRAW